MRAEPLAFVVMFKRHEGQKFSHIAAISRLCILGSSRQRAQTVQPMLQCIAAGGRDQAHDSQ